MTNENQFYGGMSAEHLKQYVERIEKLEEEKRDIADSIKEVYASAKGEGFDTKALREIIKLRKLDDSERDEQEHILDIYKRAIGMKIIEDVE